MITVMNLGGQELKLAANGATPLRYKMIFGKDLLCEINKMHKDEKDEGELVEMVTQLAFVMNKQATCDKQELAKLNKNELLEWLEQFNSAFCFAEKASEILSFYLGNESTDSKPKNEQGQAKES